MLKLLRLNKRNFNILNPLYPEPNYTPKLNLSNKQNVKQIVENNYKKKLTKNSKLDKKFKGHLRGKIYKSLMNRLKVENSHNNEGFVKGFGFNEFIKNFEENKNKSLSINKLEESFEGIYKKLNIMNKNELFLIAKSSFIRNLKDSTIFKERVKNILLKNLVDMIYEKKYKEIINYSENDLNFNNFKDLNKKEIKDKLIEDNVVLKTQKIRTLSDKLSRFKFQSDLVTKLDKSPLDNSNKKVEELSSVFTKKHGGNISYNLVIPQDDKFINLDKNIYFLDNQKDNERNNLIDPINNKIKNIIKDKSYIESENTYDKYYKEFEEKEFLEEGDKDEEEIDEMKNYYKNNKDKYNSNKSNEEETIGFDLDHIFNEEVLDKRIRLLEKHIGVVPQIPQLIDLEEEMENVIENLPDFLKEKINNDRIKEENNPESVNFNSELLTKDIRPELLFWDSIDKNFDNEIKFYNLEKRELNNNDEITQNIDTVESDDDNDDIPLPKKVEKNINMEQRTINLDTSPNIMDNYYPLLEEKEREIINHFDKYPNEEVDDSKINSSINEIMIYQNLGKDPYYHHYLNNIFKTNENALYDDLVQSRLEKVKDSDDNNFVYNYESQHIDTLNVENNEDFEIENLFNKTVSSSGMRKTAKANAFIKKGTGEILVNRRRFIEYFPELVQRHSVLRPIYLTNLTLEVDIKVNVYGSGLMSQAEACGNAIAKALAKLNPILHEILEKNKLLKGDYRQREPKTTGLYRARKKYPYKRR